jgi:hypothetical protein
VDELDETAHQKCKKAGYDRNQIIRRLSEELSCENFSGGLECKRGGKIIASAIEEADPINTIPAEVFLK